LERRREGVVPVVSGGTRRVNYIPCPSGPRDLEEQHVGAGSAAMHSEDAWVLEAATVCGMEVYEDAEMVPGDRLPGGGVEALRALLAADGQRKMARVASVP
jgi:hypothetical protein